MNHALVHKRKNKKATGSNHHNYKQSAKQNNTVKQLLARHRIQPKLKISQPDDPLEREADEMADRVMGMGNTQAAERSVVQAKSENPTNSQDTTRLPGKLKNDIEFLSGYPMDDVKVHYNSPQPARLDAHAFTKGTDIHIAPGAEKHLPHEAWHVVQQKQGRVWPTWQLGGSVGVNDDVGLEREADLMGEKVLDMRHATNNKALKNTIVSDGYIQFRSQIHTPVSKIEQMLNTATFSGFSVAFSIPSINAREFEKQADQYAKDHDAIAIKRNKIVFGKALDIKDKGISEMIREIFDKIRAKLPNNQNLKKLKIKNIAIFTHGLHDQIQAAPRKKWIKNSLSNFATSLTSYLTKSPKIIFYACNAAGTPKIDRKLTNLKFEGITPARIRHKIRRIKNYYVRKTRETDDKKRKRHYSYMLGIIKRINHELQKPNPDTVKAKRFIDHYKSFAEKFLIALSNKFKQKYPRVSFSPEIWGHTDAGHTTGNPRLRYFKYRDNFLHSDDLLNTNQLFECLSESSKKNYEVIYQILKTSGSQKTKNVAKKTLNYINKILWQLFNPSKFTPKSPINNFVREIPFMGIKRVFRDLKSDRIPEFKYLNLTDEATERLKDGFKKIKKRYKEKIKHLEEYSKKQLSLLLRKKI